MNPSVHFQKPSALSVLILSVAFPPPILWLKYFKENLRHYVILLSNTLICVLKKRKGQEKCPHSEQFSTFHKNIIKQYDRTEIKHIGHIGLISVVTKKKKKR